MKILRFSWEPHQIEVKSTQGPRKVARLFGVNNATFFDLVHLQ